MRARHQKVSAIATDGDATKVQGPDWNDDHLPALVLDAKVANYTILAADGGELLRAGHSATITFTLPAASGVDAGWCVWIENKQTGTGAASALAIARSGSDTIDGVATIYTYPGDLRVIFRTSASTFESVLLRGGMVTVLNTAGETIYWPSAAGWVELEAWGGGGSGGAGTCNVAAAVSSGGCAGGGGAKMQLRMSAARYAPSTAHVHTPAATRAGPAGRSTTGAGTAGAAGNTTTITDGGSIVIRAFGGGGGIGGGAGGTNLGVGAGGGSHIEAGNTVSNGFGGRGGGNHTIVGGHLSGSVYCGSSGGGGNAHMMGGSVFGGGGGGGTHTDGLSYTAPGSGSLYGGAGGGPGGGVTTGNVGVAGIAGGATGNAHNYSDNLRGGGGAGGGVGVGGGDGSQTPGNFIATEAGGGGGGSATANAGRGGHGGIASGGGGGGGSRTGFTSGAGGDGGQGATRMSYG